MRFDDSVGNMTISDLLYYQLNYLRSLPEYKSGNLTPFQKGEERACLEMISDAKVFTAAQFVQECDSLIRFARQQRQSPDITEEKAQELAGFGKQIRRVMGWLDPRMAREEKRLDQEEPQRP